MTGVLVIQTEDSGGGKPSVIGNCRSANTSLPGFKRKMQLSFFQMKCDNFFSPKLQNLIYKTRLLSIALKTLHPSTDVFIPQAGCVG